jgi:ABC-type amino acid transport substrate-binding protein
MLPLIAGLVACGSTSSAATPTPTYSTLITPGTITAFTLTDGAPFASVNTTTAQWTGYEIALTERIASDLHMKITYAGTDDFSTLLPSVAEGLDDICFVSIADTDARRGAVDFSLPDYTGTNNLMVLNSSSIPSGPQQVGTTEPTSVTGVKVGVVTATLEANYAAKYFPTAQLVDFPNPTAAVLALVGGSVDSIFIDGQDADLYAAQYAVHTAFTTVDPSNRGAAIVFNKNDTKLRLAFNADLQKLLANGTIASLLKQYDSAEPTGPITSFLNTYYQANAKTAYYTH